MHRTISLSSFFHRTSTPRDSRPIKPPPRTRRRHSSTITTPPLKPPSSSRVCCSLCRDVLPVGSRPYRFPRFAPAAIAVLKSAICPSPRVASSTQLVFCRPCWVWIHNLSICWMCGDMVSRLEGRVAFGWCWWHWACVSCLFCKVRVS